MRATVVRTTPHSSLLTPHSSLLTPHSSLLTNFVSTRQNDSRGNGEWTKGQHSWNISITKEARMDPEVVLDLSADQEMVEKKCCAAAEQPIPRERGGWRGTHQQPHQEA